MVANETAGSVGQRGENQLLEFLAATEHRQLALERRVHRQSLLIGFLLSVLLLAAGVGLSGAIAGNGGQAGTGQSPMSGQQAVERREQLLQMLPEDKRVELEQFEAKLGWLSQYMGTMDNFNAGAAVAMFLSEMSANMSAMPKMHREMQAMNVQMSAVPVMAAEMRVINAQLGIITRDMDSTMGRAGRAMQWMPFQP